MFGNIVVRGKPLVPANPLLRVPPVALLGVNDVEKISLLEAQIVICARVVVVLPPNSGQLASSRGGSGRERRRWPYRYLRLFV